MPYAVCVNAEPMPGDVGFGVYHNPDAEIAVAGDLLQVTFYLIAADVTEADQQTNLRTPLPKEIFVKPGQETRTGMTLSFGYMSVQITLRYE